MIDGVSVHNGENGFAIHLRRSSKDDGFIAEQGTSWVFISDETLGVLPRVGELLRTGDIAALIEEGLVRPPTGKKLGALFTSGK